jgi:hypothetical protein
MSQLQYRERDRVLVGFFGANNEDHAALKARERVITPEDRLTLMFIKDSQNL